jgi:methionyl-tRNA formyltransferase
MKLVFFGTPQFAVPSLERLLREDAFEVAAVVTQPDKRRGRGNALIPSPVKAIAEQHQIPVWQPSRVKKDEATLTQLRDTQADAFVVVAYGQILSQAMLDMPRLGCVNAHGSILPNYRGAAPIQWSIYHGELETGITTMLMDAGMDTGAMLLEHRTPINLLDTSVTLAERLAAIAADLLVDTLRGLEAGSLTPIPQDHDQATYAPLIQKTDYALDWQKGAIALHNQIRGFYPNCVATLRGQSLKITQSIPIHPGITLPNELDALTGLVNSIELPSDQPPGTVIALLKSYGPLVQTGDGTLLLREMQLAGKRSQSGWDFVNGMRLDVGEKLTNG